MRRIISLLFVCFSTGAFAGNFSKTGPDGVKDTLVLVMTAEQLNMSGDHFLPPVPDSLAGNEKPRFVKENRKLVAALLAIPPFGMVGLHRIYLHSKPYVPLVYLVTLGGFGILPLIDCAVILIADDRQMKEYENNPKIFMWLK